MSDIWASKSLVPIVHLPLHMFVVHCTHITALKFPLICYRKSANSRSFMSCGFSTISCDCFLDYVSCERGCTCKVTAIFQRMFRIHRSTHDTRLAQICWLGHKQQCSKVLRWVLRVREPHSLKCRTDLFCKIPYSPMKKKIIFNCFWKTKLSLWIRETQSKMSHRVWSTEQISFVVKSLFTY